MDFSAEFLSQAKIIVGALTGAFARLFLVPAKTFWKSVGLILISTMLGWLCTPFLLYLTGWPESAGAPVGALVAAMGLILLNAAIKIEWGEYITGWLPKRKP